MTIRLYVKPGCPFCERGRGFLIDLRRTFVERDIERDLEARRELLLIIGRTDAPVLTAGYHAAIGFDEGTWLRVLAHGEAADIKDPFALPSELGPDPTKI